MLSFYLRGALNILLDTSTLIATAQSIFAPLNPYENTVFLHRLNADTAYTGLKKRVSHDFAIARLGHRGEFVQGVDEGLVTQQEIVALTSDACSGPLGSG